MASGFYTASEAPALPSSRPEFERAVDRYARAYKAIDQQQRENLPVLDSQKADLKQAGQQLDKAMPGSAKLMQSTLKHDETTRKAAVELSGRERTAELTHVHPHMLRHSCGFYLADQGYDLRLIQDYLGHRDPKHTVHYTRVAGRRFNGLWPGS